MKIAWKVYSFLFFTSSLNNAVILLDKNSAFSIYYNITIIFSGWHTIPYFLNIFNVFIACLIALYIFAYAFDMPDLPSLPVWFFYVRLLSDIFGHSYEFKMVLSGFIQGKLIGLLAASTLVLPLFPSYLAQWRMTFNHKKGDRYIFG